MKYTLITIGILAFLLFAFLRIRVILTANQFKGVTEKYGNKGFNDLKLQKLMEGVGWKTGQPWCGYFVKALWLKTFEYDKDKLANILSGSTQQMWKNALQDNTGTVKTDKYPKLGDIAIWTKYTNRYPTSKGHAGIVTDVSDEDFKTIEGNTGDGGGRSGYMVNINNHNLNEYEINNGLRLQGFIRKKIL
jgi:hypothetical protein